MKVKANPMYPRFRRLLSQDRELLRPWKGASYRVTTLDYPHARDILSGEGSYRHGGRWNAPGAFRAVYGSTSDVIAVAESRATADYVGVPYPFRAARLLVTIELDLALLLDLTNREVLDALEMSTNDFREEDWRKVQSGGEESMTQIFGRACFEIGANGLLAPSARVRDGINVVYFPENKSHSKEAIVCESEKLDRIRAVYE